MVLCPLLEAGRDPIGVASLLERGVQVADDEATGIAAAGWMGSYWAVSIALVSAWAPRIA